MDDDGVDVGTLSGTSGTRTSKRPVKRSEEELMETKLLRVVADRLSVINQKPAEPHRYDMSGVPLKFIYAAKSWACKLAKMEADQAAKAEKAINDIL